jgi:hypothetical protein
MTIAIALAWALGFDAALLSHHPSTLPGRAAESLGIRHRTTGNNQMGEPEFRYVNSSWEYVPAHWGQRQQVDVSVTFMSFTSNPGIWAPLRRTATVASFLNPIDIQALTPEMDAALRVKVREVLATHGTDVARFPDKCIKATVTGVHTESAILWGGVLHNLLATLAFVALLVSIHRCIANLRLARVYSRGFCCLH